jgi:hypothetical protein
MREPELAEPSGSDELRAAYLLALGTDCAARGHLAEAEQLYHRVLDIVGEAPEE